MYIRNGFEFDDFYAEVKLPDSTVGATARLSASSVTNPIDFAPFIMTIKAKYTHWTVNALTS
jgi:hypothetical protein